MSDGAAFPTVVRMMLDELDGPALIELERALRGQLTPKAETPAQRRARRLGFLAQLIEDTGSRARRASSTTSYGRPRRRQARN